MHATPTPRDSSPPDDLAAIQPDAWLLDPAIAFLNHGSFGACPRIILERQQELREKLEREPVDFLVRKLTPLIDQSRATLAALLGSDPADLVFVQNATAGVNSVVRSLDFKPGDEILVTNHDYNACRNVIRYRAQQTGAVVIEVALPLPITSPRQVLDAVLERVTVRTRLAMLDHVTSPTALIFPIDDLVRELDRRGVDTLVDGAHAPGMIPLDIRKIGAAYYTGNCHKWLCTPKTVGFLHVRPDRQSRIQPTIVSHGWNRSRPDHSSFQDAFDWPGTFDPTPWLCIGPSIEFLQGLLPSGLDALMNRNRRLAIRAREILGTQPWLSPVGPESMLGSMAAFCLPEIAQPMEEERINQELRSRFGIEVPVFYWPNAPQMLLRISAHAYNYPAQYEQLAPVLPQLL